MTFSPKNILVPVDVDPSADHALAERLVDDACAFAKVNAGSLVLLHVAQPVISPMTPLADLVSGGAYRAMLDVAEARNSASARGLKALEERARAAGITVRVVITNRAGSTPQSIVDVADEEKSDLIMMTSHARHGVRRMLLGSVAERTAHLAHVPVLLLPVAAT